MLNPPLSCSHRNTNAKAGEAEVERVIRTAGNAFEDVAAKANSTLALAWLEPLHQEYLKWGLKEDAARVQVVIVERGRSVADELKEIRIPIQLDERLFDRLMDQLTEGAMRDALLRITGHLVPKIDDIKELLQRQITQASFLAMIGITQMVEGRSAARVGSIEEDPDGV